LEGIEKIEEQESSYLLTDNNKEVLNLFKEIFEDESISDL